MLHQMLQCSAIICKSIAKVGCSVEVSCRPRGWLYHALGLQEISTEPGNELHFLVFALDGVVARGFLTWLSATTAEIGVCAVGSTGSTWTINRLGDLVEGLL